MTATDKLRHKIYTGSFEALEIQWQETVADLQRNDPLKEVAVLVGSNILVTYLRRRTAGNGRSAANIRFYNFRDLLGYINSVPVSNPDRRRIPPLGAEVLLRSLLEDHVNLPKAYAPISGYKGFCDTLLETFRDLRDADIVPDDLDRAVTAVRRAADRREQLESFAGLYRRYRSEVCRFRDADDDFRDAIEKLKQVPAVGDSSPLLVYGIYDATGQQARLLDALGRTRPMIYFIPFTETAVSEFARPFLDARASSLGVDPQPLLPPIKTDSLGRLVERNFGLSRSREYNGALEDDGSFALISAPGESRAAVEVVREILRAVRDGVISGFHEAAVILRNPENDIPILSEALRLRKVPYFIHGGEKFFNRPLGKAILALSSLEISDFSRDAILTAVEFIGAALPSAEAEEWDVENWRVLTHEAESLSDVRAWDATTRGILRCAIENVRRIEQMQEVDSEKLSEANERLASARRLRQNWRKLRAAAAGWPARASFAEWAKFLIQRFEKILKTSPDWPYLASALDKIAELETLAQSGTQKKKYEICSAAKIRSLLDEAIQSLKYPVGRFQRDGVNLVSVSAARGLRFPLVVIPGLEEGRFPSRLRQDPLLPDAERRRLRGVPLRGARAEEEKLLFDMAARSAMNRLILVTSRLDESADREKFPSLFFLRAASTACGGRISPGFSDVGKIPGFRLVSLDPTAPMEGTTAVDEGEIRLRWITSEKLPASRAIAELALMEPQRLRTLLEYEQSRRKARLTGFDGLISDPELLRWTHQKLDSGSGQMSASRFEEYARCPYSFFLKRILGIRILDDDRGITESMDPLQRGTGVHAALESFLKKHVSECLASVSKEQLWAALECEARRELEKKRPIGMPGLLWEIERDRLLTLLRNWLEFEIARADGDMRIAQLEWAFGNISEFPPFSLTMGQSIFEFCGKIDRVDVSIDGKRARVIDYKTGKLPVTMKKKDRPFLMGGEKIQLAVYRGAFAALDEFAAVESVEAEYLYLQPKDGEVKQSALAPEDVDAAFADLPRVLQVLDLSMKNGLFFARTFGTVRPEGHCDYCDFLPVCGKDRVWREKLKSADPLTQEFRNLAY